LIKGFPVPGLSDMEGFSFWVLGNVSLRGLGRKAVEFRGKILLGTVFFLQEGGFTSEGWQTFLFGLSGVEVSTL